MLNEGNQIHNFLLCQLLWFHFITVPVPVPLKSVIKLRFRFHCGKMVPVPMVPVPVPQQHLWSRRSYVIVAGIFTYLLYCTVKMRHIGLSDCHFSAIRKLNKGLANLSNYRTIEYRIKASIYRTIGLTKMNEWMTHKKHSVAQLCSIFYLLARSGNETTEVL